MVRITKFKHGKYNVTVREMNEISEKAIEDCRKVVTKIMEERANKK